MKPTALILLCGLLSGCWQSYPLGLTREQWDALPPVEQAAYRARQTELDHERRRQELLAEEEGKAAERARLRNLYAQAAYGDIITVTVRKGELAFGGKRHGFEPVSFDLVRGEAKAITFHRAGRPHETATIEMRLNDNGNVFTFDVPAHRRFVVANDGWAKGRTYAVHEIGSREGPSEAKGVELTISYRPMTAPTHPSRPEFLTPAH